MFFTVKKRVLTNFLVLAVSALCLSCAQQTSIPASKVSDKSSTVPVKASNKSAASLRLHELVEQIWQYEITQFPSLAKSKGKQAHLLKRQFTDISLAAKQARHERFTQFYEALENINASELNNTEGITLLMQKYRIKNYISQFIYKEHRVPITSEYGFHSSLGAAMTRVRINNTNDLAVYKQMLVELPEQFSINIEYMKEGLANGHTQPQAVLKGYQDTITAYISNDIEQHPFYQPIAKAKDGVLSAHDISKFKELVALANSAFQGFYEFFTTQYVPRANTDIAATKWPQGEAFYNNRIKHFTTTNMTAQEIHELGLKEVARIRSEMQIIVDTLIEKGEFSGDINSFIHYLRTDPKFYAKTPEELIMYASYVSKQMDAQLPKLFYKMPRTPYGVAPVPDSIAPKYTTGRYISPRSDDQPGYYWVNTYALDKRPLYAIPALTLHEAVPGHHFQISLAAEMQNLPEVRRSTYISAFGEGWGLYSEFLGVEVGIYDDPYDDFGRLSYEMWRACRLVVDTGMHVFGWSREKALAYMLENTALSEHNVRTEIDRYISWPGQALSYKIGEIKIKELRSKAEQQLGEHFDLRAFHDALLENGSIPLFVLEQKMNDFINEVKATQK